MDMIPRSISKSISEIMANFDFEECAKIEETFYPHEDVKGELVHHIKDFVHEGLYETYEKFKDEKQNCFMGTTYHLKFIYVYDEKEPWMELEYVPVSWEKY